MSGPPPPWEGWQPPPPPPPHNTALVVVMTFVGLVVYSLVNVVSFIAVIGPLNGSGNAPTLVAYAVVLALAALGGGVLLLLLRRPWAKGLGLGFMIGWGLWSILSAGICTGINPTIYS